MAHFKTETWVDYLNQVVIGEEKKLMEQHLKQGCKSCMETLAIWEKVRNSATAERNYQPPEDTVRVTKAAFAGAGLAEKQSGSSSGVQLLFDSFLQPVFAGTRSAGSTSRQMLYRADPFQIDLQVEAKHGNRIVVTGQLLDLEKSENGARDARIILSNLQGHVVDTVANQFGEFSGEIENSGDLQLTFANPGGKPIVICLREAIRDLPGGRS